MPQRFFRNTPSVVALADEAYERGVAAGLLQVTLRNRDQKRVELSDGRWVVEFVGCSYLGLDLRPEVIESGARTLAAWGVHHCCARSRFSIGPLKVLEDGLARLFAGPAVTFPSVTSAHQSALPLVASGVLLENTGRPVRLVFDRLAHASMQYLRPILADEADIETIGHNDLRALEIAATRARESDESLVYVADGVYSMGGACPIDELLDLSEALGFWLYVDDAHGTSIFGERGEGFVLSRAGLPRPARLFVTFSLSKGFGCNGGGIVLPSRRHEHLIRRYGQSYAFSGPLDFAVVGSALEVLKLHRNGDVRRLQAELRRKVALFDEVLGRSEPFSPLRIVPAGDSDTAIDWAERLLQRGYFVTAAFFPVVPRDSAQLRVALTVDHEDDDVAGLATCLRELERRRDG